MTLYTTSLVFEAENEVERARKFKRILKAMREIDVNIQVYEAEELVP